VLCYQPLHQESFSFGFLNANEMLPFISFPWWDFSQEAGVEFSFQLLWSHMSSSKVIVGVQEWLQASKSVSGCGCPRVIGCQGWVSFSKEWLLSEFSCPGVSRDDQEWLWVPKSEITLLIITKKQNSPRKFQSANGWFQMFNF
jgi:hypothetical protein